LGFLHRGFILLRVKGDDGARVDCGGKAKARLWVLRGGVLKADYFIKVKWEKICAGHKSLKCAGEKEK